MKNRFLLVLAAATLPALGCLDDGTRHTFYLDPDGAVTWAVAQDEVRPGGPDPAAAARALLENVGRRDHAVARALRALDPLWLDAQVIRERVPFALRTEARFAAIDRVLQAFLEGSGLDARSELRLAGDEATLTLRFREREDRSPSAAERETEELLSALIADPESYRFVLTEGRFVAASGFRLERDDTAAVMLELDGEEAASADGGPAYSLTWRR